MNEREFWDLDGVSDAELHAGLGKLLGAGARLEARVVAHLAEVDARRLHLVAGCSSLYDYCRKHLQLSDYEAFSRIATARVARKYPMVFRMLERRDLNLTAVCEVREFLTAENHGELLSEIARKTKLQIREILARRFPRADVASSLKRLPKLEPLSPGRYRLEITLSDEEKALLERARDLISHANPSGDLAVVVVSGIEALIQRVETRRFGARGAHAQQGSCASREPRGSLAKVERSENLRPKDGAAEAGAAKNSMGRGEGPGRGEGRRKHIAHEVRRDVRARDGARCAFVAPDGSRCEARGFLQFHHQHAWAGGGCDSADNLQILCAGHNRLLAESEFGVSHIEAQIGRRDLAQPRRGK